MWVACCFCDGCDACGLLEAFADDVAVVGVEFHEVGGASCLVCCDKG